MMSLGFLETDDDVPSTREEDENVCVLNAAEALLQECIIQRFLDGGDPAASSQHEELWSGGDGFILWMLATADLTKLKL